jgi:hypothetical protein
MVKSGTTYKVPLSRVKQYALTLFQLSTPTGLSVNPSGTTTDATPTWTWNAVSNASSYQIRLNNGTAISVGSNTTYTPGSDLTGEQSLQVRAVGAGNYITSSWSSAVAVTIITEEISEIYESGELQGCGFPPAAVETLSDGQPRFQLINRTEAPGGEGFNILTAITHAEGLGGSVACASTPEKHNQLALTYLLTHDTFSNTLDVNLRYWLGATSPDGRNYTWIDNLDPNFTYGYSQDLPSDPNAESANPSYTLGRFECAKLNDTGTQYGLLGYILDRLPADHELNGGPK